MSTALLVDVPVSTMIMLHRSAQESFLAEVERVLIRENDCIDTLLNRLFIMFTLWLQTNGGQDGCHGGWLTRWLGRWLFGEAVETTI
jgi:hypothetical protein